MIDHAARLLILRGREDPADEWSAALGRNGYRVEVALRDGIRAEEIVQRRPDLVLVGLHPPHERAFRLCRRLRGDPRSSTLPVILVAARRAEMECLAGRAAGADDCLQRPVSETLLVARIERALRCRGVLPSAPRDMRAGPIEISPLRHRVFVNGAPVSDITYLEFRTLQVMAEHAGRTLSRRQILDLTHHDPETVSDRSVDALIVGLRRKLGACADWIESVRSVGYRLRTDDEAPSSDAVSVP